MRPFVVLALSGTLLTSWLARDAILASVGGLIVAEDPLQPADALVVSLASTRAGSLEAARLYHQRLAPLVIVPRESETPADHDIRALGVALLAPHELARAILERRGVPRTAIVVLDEPVDGTAHEV